MPLLRYNSRREVILLLIGLSGLFVIASLLYDESPLSNQRLAELGPSSFLNSFSHKAETEPIHKVDLGVSPVIPRTTIIAHAPGWTLYRNLYMSNGTLFIVTPKEERANIPHIRMMTSTGLEANVSPENIAAREPTEHEMQVISPESAHAKWGGNVAVGERNRVWTVEGTTFLVNEPWQFLNHYYHFVAELFLGAWAFMYGAFNPNSGLNVSLSADILNGLKITSSQSFNFHPVSVYSPPDISRIIFIHASADGWRDKPGFNAFFLRAVLPSVDVEVATDWADRVKATMSQSQRGRAWHFPIALLSDRSAAFRGEACGSRTQRIAAEAWELMVGRGGVDAFGQWWKNVRDSVARFAGVKHNVAEENLAANINRLPLHRPSADITDAQGLLPTPENVVITYINRQGVRRHLVAEDHAGLVRALEQLIARKKNEGRNWKLKVVQPELLSKDEQVQLAAETTIMIGVHGNGLTHLVLMQPNKFSTIIELFYPGGFARDYEWTTRALGMRHYTVWNDTYFTHPNEPPIGYPEGFQGSKIPVHGPTVAKLIEQRLEGKLQY